MFLPVFDVYCNWNFKLVKQFWTQITTRWESLGKITFRYFTINSPNLHHIFFLRVKKMALDSSVAVFELCRHLVPDSENLSIRVVYDSIHFAVKKQYSFEEHISRNCKQTHCLKRRGKKLLLRDENLLRIIKFDWYKNHGEQMNFSEIMWAREWAD